MKALKIILPTLFLAALLASCSNSQQTAENKPAGQPSAPSTQPQTPSAQPAGGGGGSAATIAELYNKNCVVCHQADGKGAPMFKEQGIPDFTDAAWQAKETDADFIEVITNGKEEGGKKKMPAFKDKLTSEQIKEMVTYVRNFAKKS